MSKTTPVIHDKVEQVLDTLLQIVAQKLEAYFLAVLCLLLLFLLHLQEVLFIHLAECK
jgi:hypothetical protein